MDFTLEQTKEIRRRIKKQIAAKNMKMKQFYEKSGVSSSLFSQYGTGKSTASLLSVQRMVNAVEMDIDVLLDGIDKENPAPTNEDGTDEAILRFLHSLPIEKLVGILTLVDAPKELIAALDLEERKE